MHFLIAPFHTDNQSWTYLTRPSYQQPFRRHQIADKNSRSRACTGISLEYLKYWLYRNNISDAISAFELSNIWVNLIIITIGNLYDLILIHTSGLEHGLEILLAGWIYLILISVFNFLSFSMISYHCSVILSLFIISYLFCNYLSRFVFISLYLWLSARRIVCTFVWIFVIICYMGPHDHVTELLFVFPYYL